MFERLRMPSLGGDDGWLNSEPLDPAELRGHVVLVNFWTLTCINWLRQVPFVRAWSRAYRPDGLIVIGVHAPEFSFEHRIDLVRQAVGDRAIDYPVVLDNDHRIWNRFGNRYWPAIYFVDADGIIHDQTFGEGRYERSERIVQRLLGVERELVSVEGRDIEAEADWDELWTPETYLGQERGERFAGALGFEPPGAFRLPEQLLLHHWDLEGDWTIGRECVVLDRAEGSIACRFHARDANLVLNTSQRAPIPFRVLVDGRPPGRSRGSDVDADGHGTLREGRLYQLSRAREPVRERTLEITFTEPGVEAYAFTYG